MELEKKIYDLKTRIDMKRWVEKKLDEVNKDLQYIHKKRIDLQYSLSQFGVNFLEIEKNYSIVDIWYNLLAKEEEQFSEIEHNYKIIDDIYKGMQYEIKNYKEILFDTTSLEHDYRKLLSEEKELKQSEDNTFVSRGLDDKTIALKNNVKAINEVLGQVSLLHDALSYLLGHLEQVKSWKVVDIFGKGLIANIAKRSYIPEASSKLNKIHYRANKFYRDLKAIQYLLDINLDILKFYNFSTYFHDELYHDLSDSKKMLNIIDFIKISHVNMNMLSKELMEIKESYINQILQNENEKKQNKD